MMECKLKLVSSLINECKLCMDHWMSLCSSLEAKLESYSLPHDKDNHSTMCCPFCPFLVYISSEWTLLYQDDEKVTKQGHE